MRFSITRETLLKPLQIVGGVVEKRQTLPILSNVLVKVDTELLTLVGTDLEVELIAEAPLEAAETGEVTIPARKLIDICRSLPEGCRIDIQVDGEKASVKSGKSRFTLSTINSAEFPLAEMGAGTFSLDLPQHAVRNLLEKTQFCMANQDVRYYLNGLLIEIDNGSVKAVATDGHRLAFAVLATEAMPGNKVQAIIPRKGIVELARLLEDSEEPCTILLSNNSIQVKANGMTFTSKLIDGRFPDYQRVIPKEGEKVVTADRESIRSSLMRVAILSNEKYRGIRLGISNDLIHATVNNPEQEEASEEIPVSYSGDPLEIGFNVNYLVDALNAIKTEQVDIHLTDANSSCLIIGKGEDQAKYVVMPMRL